MTNLLITKDWRVWLIDSSRAFRMAKTLQEPERLTSVDRKLLGTMKGLTRDGLRKRLSRWLNNDQIDAILARRDLIVSIFEKQIASKGEATVVYDLARTSEPCGAGLQ
jgi:hypothetical protein